MRLTPEQEAEIRAARDVKHETRRPTVPALEEVLYEAMPVLDHGFVRVIDYMGDDAAIVQAARVSYGKGTKKVSEDRGLIRYLMRHRHTTPLEMAEIKLHCKLPIFVARQWIRHRTACLAGDTRLSFDLPGAWRRGRRQLLARRIESVFRLWTEGTRGETAEKKKPTFVERIEPTTRYTIPELSRLVLRREETLRNMVRDGYLVGEREGNRIYVRGSAWHDFAKRKRVFRVPMRDRVRRQLLRMCDETTGEIRHTHIVDVWQTGTRPVYRVTLENGYSIEMTKDHRCLTERGWMTLQEATGLRKGETGSVRWNGAAPAFAVNGVRLHRDPQWVAARRAEGWNVHQIADAAGVSYHTIRKALRQHGLQFTARERARLSGRSQRGQRRAFRRRGPLRPEALERVRTARSGRASNFWKGGITPERANIGRWTREHAAFVHERYGWRCGICRSKTRLHAHHADPVWHCAARARDLTNLVTLCGACHEDIHRLELELAFLAEFETGRPLAEFWTLHPERGIRPADKPRGRPTRLVRTFSKLARIDYVGEKPTYDLEVEGPYHNFVANGFIVHNSVNEYSARYSILDREFYVPRPEDLGVQSLANRQGRAETLPAARAAEILRILKEDAERNYDHYTDMMNADEEGKEIRPGEPGLARELARMNLTLAFYTQWYWKIDLHNLLHFLSLRLDDHAQEEIRAYGRVIADVTKRWVPHAWEAFVDFRLEGTNLSRGEKLALQKMLMGETPDLAALGLSKREQDEFQKKFPKK
jgi:thymidylate synthase (FAD)